MRSRLTRKSGAPVRHLAPLGTRLMFERKGKMKIVAIGGTGLIGSKTIVLLRRAGHDALLEAALDDADVVIDLANS
jgi:hypothetical protein